jgi:hypothetical protein
MPESKKAAEFQNRHEQIMKMIKKMGDYPRVLPVRPVRPTIPRVLPTIPVRPVSTGSLKLPRVLPTIPVRSASMGNSGVRSQTPYYSPHSNKIREGTPYPKEESRTPRPQTPYYNQQPSNMIRTGTPYAKEESHQRRSQTPYYNQRPSNMIRTGTPYPKKEEPRPVFSSDIKKERTVKDLTKFFEKFINNNTRGGKYNKNKVGKKSKRVVKANKK